MNTPRISLASRLCSLALAALVTASMAYSIDTLAHRDFAADSLMAQAHAARPA